MYELIQAKGSSYHIVHIRHAKAGGPLEHFQAGTKQRRRQEHPHHPPLPEIFPAQQDAQGQK